MISLPLVVVASSGTSSSRAMRHQAPQVSPFISDKLPNIALPTTWVTRTSPSLRPLSVCDVFQASPCNRTLAVTPCRIEFVIVRTASSPPVALHPASRQRSYFRLRGAWAYPDTDFHHAVCTPSRAHDCRAALRNDGAGWFGRCAMTRLMKCLVASCVTATSFTASNLNASLVEGLASENSASFSLTAVQEIIEGCRK